MINSRRRAGSKYVHPIGAKLTEGAMVYCSGSCWGTEGLRTRRDGVCSAELADQFGAAGFYIEIGEGVRGVSKQIQL